MSSADSGKKGSKEKKPEIPYDPHKKLRAWTIVTQLENPIKPGEKYINEDVQGVIDGWIDQINKYAWIRHDKDVVNEEILSYHRKRAVTVKDSKIQAYHLTQNIGDPVKEHFHIVISFKNAMSRQAVAKKFGCNLECIKGSIRGEGMLYKTFSAPVLLYLLHRNAEGKHQYDISELHCDPESREELQRLIEKYDTEKEITQSKSVDQILKEIKEGKSLEEVYNDPKVANSVFVKNKRLFSDAEEAARLYGTEVPKYLLNIYICGDTGSGKTSFAKMLIRYMYPQEKDPYFITGSKSVVFQTYGGQKVILWDDITVDKMHSAATNGDIQTLLDPNQREKSARNVKNSYKILLNEVNVFTSTVSHKEFCEKVLTDKTPFVQIYRRIPINININIDSIVLNIDKGVWDDNPSQWGHYYEILIARLDMGKIMKEIPDDRIPEIMEGVLSSITQIINKLKKKYTEKNAKLAQEIIKSNNVELLVSGIDDRFLNKNERDRIIEKDQLARRELWEEAKMEQVEGEKILTEWFDELADKMYEE